MTNQPRFRHSIEASASADLAEQRWSRPIIVADNREVEPMPVLDFASFAPKEELAVDTHHFRDSMRHLAGAVSVITVGRGEDRTGFTATSVSSLSVEPPSVVVNLNRSSSSWPVLQRYGSFAVNVLADDQQHIADRFAGRGGVKGVHRYDGADWSELVTGTPSLSGALTVLDCELDEAIERHSHSILIGRVRAITVRGEAQPLLYWHGAYRHISAPLGG